MRLPWENLLVLYVLIFSSVALATAGTEPVKAPQNLPASVSSELEMAAKALAEGQLDTASKWFEAVVQNTSVRPFIRGLSMLGLAQVELARQDAGAAIAAVCLRWAWPPPFNLSNVVCFRTSAVKWENKMGMLRPAMRVPFEHANKQPGPAPVGTGPGSAQIYVAVREEGTSHVTSI